MSDRAATPRDDTTGDKGETDEMRRDERSSVDERPTAGTAAGSQAGFGLVEALIAFVILSVGLLAIAGIALSVAAQTHDAAYVTDQDMAAQQVLEVTATSQFSSVPAGTSDTTVSVGGNSYTVTRTVTQVSPRTKKVQVDVPGQPGEADETMVTYLYAPRGLPSP